MMTVLRCLLCAVALAAVAACGGKTKTPTKPVADSAKKSYKPNPCAQNPMNPCGGAAIDNPCAGTGINPCHGPMINPCGPGSSDSDPASRNPRLDPSSKKPGS